MEKTVGKFSLKRQGIIYKYKLCLYKYKLYL